MTTPDPDSSTDEDVERGVDPDIEDDIEEERSRRLDPDNRPEGAEVDNTGDNMPDFVKESHSGEGVDGSSDPAQAFRDNVPSDEEIAEIAEDREQCLDPDNRPEGAEVDNTASARTTNDD